MFYIVRAAMYRAIRSRKFPPPIRRLNMRSDDARSPACTSLCGKGPEISPRIHRVKTRRNRGNARAAHAPWRDCDRPVTDCSEWVICGRVRWTQSRNAAELLLWNAPALYSLDRWRVPIAGPSVAKRPGLRAGRCVVCLVEDMTVRRFDDPLACIKAYALQHVLSCTDRKVRVRALYVHCQVRSRADRRKGAPRGCLRWR